MTNLFRMLFFPCASCQVGVEMSSFAQNAFKCKIKGVLISEVKLFSSRENLSFGKCN